MSAESNRIMLPRSLHFYSGSLLAKGVSGKDHGLSKSFVNETTASEVFPGQLIKLTENMRIQQLVLH